MLTDEPEGCVGVIAAKVAAAIAANSVMSAKLCDLLKTLKLLKAHGPALQTHMQEMQALPATSPLAKRTDVAKRALEAYEKYSVRMSHTALAEYRRMATAEVLTAVSAVTSPGEESVDCQLVAQVPIQISNLIFRF